MNENRNLQIYCFLTGIFFLLSSAGKILNTEAYGSSLASIGISNLRWAAPVLGLLEMITGLCLLLMIFPRLFGILASILLLVTTFFYVNQYYRGGIADCFCFGWRGLIISPWLVFIRNGILLLMSIIIIVKIPSRNKYSIRYILPITLLLVAAFTAGFSFEHVSSKPSLEQNGISAQFKGKRLDSTLLGKYIHTVPDSTYVFFCFSYGCSHCWNAIENLKKYGEIFDKIVGVASGSEKERKFFIENFRPGFEIQDIPPSTMQQLAYITPTSYFIMNDTIKGVLEGELPSVVTFRQEFAIVR